MVAYPRNQRYLHPPPVPAGVVAGEGQDAGERAGLVRLARADNLTWIVAQGVDGFQPLVTSTRVGDVIDRPHGPF
jgi:hypothetical protein